jgi:long-chain acyl-CoA synthetase
VLDPIFFGKTKAALGGRVRLMISGSAPLLPDVHSFMKVTMCAPLVEGYGQTESTGASFVTHAKDPTVGHIGGPVVHFFAIYSQVWSSSWWISQK